MHEFRLPLTVVFGGSALLALLLCLLLALAKVEVGLNLAVVGLLLGVLLPLGLEIRNRSGRKRRVLFLDYRTHHYGYAVARGLTKVLSGDKRQWSVEVVSTGSASSDGALQWQIKEVQSAVIEEYDALVIVPSEDDETLWFALAALIKARGFVVAVDTKPPNRIFRDVGIEPPRFVSSRYNETGIIIGDFLQSWLEEDDQRSCVLWTGPVGSWPGEDRSRNIVYTLAASDLLHRTLLQPIDSWTPEASRCRRTLDTIEESESTVAVYCADDENALALHLLTLTERPALRSKMLIIGCNGTPDEWGNVPVLDMRAVEATVDILAEQQGAQAGMLLVKERNGKLSPAERSVFISPRWKARELNSQRWLDSLFESDQPPEQA